MLLTKADLASPRPALMHRLKELNATAPVLVAHHGQIDHHDLLNGCLYDPLTKSLDVQSWLGADPVAHEHHHGVDTYAVVRSEPLRAVTLTLFLEVIAEHCGADLLRLKGIVNIVESPERPAVIHGVQHVFHPPTWLPRWPSRDRDTRMIFITRGIPRGWIEALLAALDAEVDGVKHVDIGVTFSNIRNLEAGARQSQRNVIINGEPNSVHQLFLSELHQSSRGERHGRKAEDGWVPAARCCVHGIGEAAVHFVGDGGRRN